MTAAAEPFHWRGSFQGALLLLAGGAPATVRLSDSVTQMLHIEASEKGTAGDCMRSGKAVTGNTELGAVHKGSRMCINTGCQQRTIYSHAPEWRRRRSLSRALESLSLPFRVRRIARIARGHYARVHRLVIRMQLAVVFLRRLSTRYGLPPYREALPHSIRNIR